MVEEKVKEGYKRTEVGIIPEDWEVRYMQSITSSISSGLSNLKTNSGQYILYGSTGVIGFNNYYNYEGTKVLVARVGANAGKVNIVTGKYGVSDNTLVISYNNVVNIKFSYYQLVNYRLNRLVFGTGQPLITGGQLKNILIPIPPLNEQESIAAVLTDTDNLIISIEKLIDKKKKIKQGTMQELLTGKKRLAGFSGEWEIKKLGELTQMQSGGTPLTSIDKYYGGKILWVSIKDMTSSTKYLKETDKTLTEEGLNNSSAVLFPKDTILYAMYASIGECVIAKDIVTSSQAILGIQCLKSVYVEYIYYYLTFIKDKMRTQGQTGTQANLNKEMVQGIITPKPSFKEQKAIAQILSDMDIEIESLEQKLSKYRTIKQGMMQELLTGRIRLI